MLSAGEFDAVRRDVLIVPPEPAVRLSGYGERSGAGIVQHDSVRGTT